MTRIRARHENATDRVATPARKPAFRRLEEARVLIKNRPQYGLRHKVLNDAVRRRGSIPLRVALESLPVGRFGVVRLVYARQEPPPGKLHGIERSSGHDRKLLLGRQRRYLAAIFEAQKIRQSIEQPVVRCARSPLLVFVWRRLLRRSRSLRLRCGRRRRIRIGRRRSLLGGAHYGQKAGERKTTGGSCNELNKQ